MAEDVIALLNEGNEMIPALEAQLKEVRSSIDNIMKAIEKGIVTRTTKSRLEELEAEEERLVLSIKAEEDKKPKITKDFILFTLNKFRNLDLRVEKNKERQIDGLVKAIFVYDNYIKVILTFDDTPITIPTTEEIEYMTNSSDIQLFASPKQKSTAKQCSFVLVTRQSDPPHCVAMRWVRIFALSRRPLARRRQGEKIFAAGEIPVPKTRKASELFVLSPRIALQLS